MRRICAITGIILIFIIPVKGAFQEQSFWSERAKKLTADKESLVSSGALDKTMAKVIDGEITRAEQMRSAHSGAAADIAAKESSLNADNVYAAFLLREIVSALPSSKEEIRAVDALRIEAEKRFESKNITPDKKFISSFMSRLTAQEKSILAIECGINARSHSYPAKKSALENALSQGGSFKEIRNHFAENPLSPPETSEMKCADSSVATHVLREADNYARTLNDAREFLGSRGLVADASTLAQSMAKPAEFGKSAFNRLSVRLCDSARFERTKGAHGIEIPAEPDMSVVFSEIDAIRTAAVSAVSSGASEESAIADADKKMHHAIFKGVNRSVNVLFTSDEKTNILQGNSKDDSVSAETKDPFTRSKNILRTKITKAHTYREANLRFIRLSYRISYLTAGNHTPVHYTERVQSFRHIASFIIDLDSRIRKSGNNDLLSIQRTLIPREKKFLETLSALSAIPESERVRLDKTELTRVLELRSAFIKEIQFAVGSIRTKEQPAIAPAHSQKTVSSLQDDENALSESIRAWTSVIGTSQRMNALLEEYALFFTQCEKDAAEGLMTERLEKVFTEKSLISSIDSTGAIGGVPGASFAQRMRDEDIRHSFIAGWIRGDLARLNSIHERDSSGTAPIRSLSDDELRGIKQAVAPHAPVKIAAWTLTPSTLRKTDSNAHAYLSRLFARTSAQKGTIPTRSVSLSDTQYAFSISIPEYFEESTFPIKDRMNSSARSAYIDTPRASTIHFMIVPDDNRGTRNKLEEFVSSISMKIVKWKESGTEGSKSLTVIGSGNGDVVEAHAVERGGMIVIIAGTSPKNRYVTLSAALKTANQSLKSAIGE